MHSSINYPLNGLGGSKHDAKVLWLDQALADQPPATRAKVLDFALKFGVGADDSDFWILIAAVGFLHTIIESAPQEWEGLLSGFTQTLNQWTTSNLEVLSALTNKAETDATQAELIRELSHTLRALTTLMVGQKQALNKLSRTLLRPGTSSTDLHEILTRQFSELSRRIEAISIPHSPKGNVKSPWNGRRSAHWSNGLMILLLAGTIISSWFLWRGQQRNAQTLQWLLYKANRVECLSGIKPADSTDCYGF